MDRLLSRIDQSFLAKFTSELNCIFLSLLRKSAAASLIAVRWRITIRNREAANMTEVEVQALVRQSEYLKLRNAQLQADPVDLTAQTERLGQAAEHTAARRAAGTAPDPPSGGQ